MKEKNEHEMKRVNQLKRSAHRVRTHAGLFNIPSG